MTVDISSLFLNLLPGFTIIVFFSLYRGALLFPVASMLCSTPLYYFFHCFLPCTLYIVMYSYVMSLMLRNMEFRNTEFRWISVCTTVECALNWLAFNFAEECLCMYMLRPVWLYCLIIYVFTYKRRRSVCCYVQLSVLCTDMYCFCRSQKRPTRCIVYYPMYFCIMWSTNMLCTVIYCWVVRTVHWYMYTVQLVNIPTKYLINPSSDEV